MTHWSWWLLTGSDSFWKWSESLSIDWYSLMAKGSNQLTVRDAEFDRAPGSAFSFGWCESSLAVTSCLHEEFSTHGVSYQPCVKSCMRWSLVQPSWFAGIRSGSELQTLSTNTESGWFLQSCGQSASLLSSLSKYSWKRSRPVGHTDSSDLAMVTSFWTLIHSETYIDFDSFSQVSRLFYLLTSACWARLASCLEVCSSQRDCLTQVASTTFGSFSIPSSIAVGTLAWSAPSN